MKKLIAVALVAGTALSAAGFALAQTRVETIAITRVDTAGLVHAVRASKVIGTAVVNDAGDKVGTIDDLLVRTDGSNRVLFAVLSVGGFLGVGNKHIVVPYASLTDGKDGKIVLPGATKDELKQLPDFKYAS